MNEIESYEAKGRPTRDPDRNPVRLALDRIAAVRQTAGKMTLEEILAARHEGHQY